MAISRELQAGAVLAGVAPGSRHSVCGSGYARQGINSADRFLVKIHNLLRSFLIGHYGDVDGEDLTRVHSRFGGLHGDKSFEKHAGAGEKHEGGGNLNNGESAQAAIGAAGDAKAAAGCKAKIGRAS